MIFRERLCVGTVEPEAVTHMNDALLAKIDMQPLESFTFKGANDDDVQGFMVKPPGFDPNKKYPLKFLIHGGPQGAWGNEWSYRWNPELFAANGIRGGDDQFPRLDRLRAEVYRLDQRRLGRQTVCRSNERDSITWRRLIRS